MTGNTLTSVFVDIQGAARQGSEAALDPSACLEFALGRIQVLAPDGDDSGEVTTRVMFFKAVRHVAISFCVDMQPGGPVNLGMGQVEGDVEGAHVLLPLQRAADVDVAIVLRLAQAHGEQDVTGVESLAQVGSERDDSCERGAAVVDGDLGGLEEAN